MDVATYISSELLAADIGICTNDHYTTKKSTHNNLSCPNSPPSAASKLWPRSFRLKNTRPAVRAQHQHDNMDGCYKAVGVAVGSMERMASRISRWTVARDGATIMSSQIEREPQVVAPPG